MNEKVNNYMFGAQYSYQKTNILDDPNSKLGNFLNKFITALIVLFIFVLIFESLGANATIFEIELLFFEAFLSLVFAWEYVYRLMKSDNKIKFIFSMGGIIDLISFLPFFLGFFIVGDIGKMLRVFRILRILRLLKKIPLTQGFIQALGEYKDEYAAVMLLFIVSLFIGSVSVYFAERTIDGSLFTSIPMALRWGLVTMTTVGYGDMYPVTSIGKILGSLLVFFGPLVIGLFSAITVMVFQETANNQKVINKHVRGISCKRCHHMNPRDANYCMKCGEAINHI